MRGPPELQNWDDTFGLHFRSRGRLNGIDSSGLPRISFSPTILPRLRGRAVSRRVMEAADLQTSRKHTQQATYRFIHLFLEYSGGFPKFLRLSHFASCFFCSCFLRLG